MRRRSRRGSVEKSAGRRALDDAEGTARSYCARLESTAPGAGESARLSLAATIREWQSRHQQSLSAPLPRGKAPVS
jgi:hypothetical protein